PSSTLFPYTTLFRSPSHSYHKSVNVKLNATLAPTNNVFLVSNSLWNKEKKGESYMFSPCGYCCHTTDGPAAIWSLECMAYRIKLVTVVVFILLLMIDEILPISGFTYNFVPIGISEPKPNPTANGLL